MIWKSHFRTLSTTVSTKIAFIYFSQLNTTDEYSQMEKISAIFVKPNIQDTCNFLM